MSTDTEQRILDILTDPESGLVAQVAALRADMRSLVGNGKPGRVKDLEDALADVKASRAFAKGKMVVFGAIVWLISLAGIALADNFWFRVK